MDVLEVVSSARYLMVDISNGLSWNSGIDRIPAKANSTFGFCQQKHKKKPVMSGAPILTPSERYSSLKRFNAGLPDGPPIRMIMGPVWQPCFRLAVSWAKMGRRASLLFLPNCVGPCGSTTPRLYPTFEFQSQYFIQRLNSNSRYCHPMTLRLIHTARDSYKYSFYQFAIVQWNALSQNIVYQTLIHSRLQWVECSIQVPRSRVSCF